MSPAAAQDSENDKISGLLALQVEAKLRALEVAPLEEGRVNILPAMQAMGMKLEDLNKQRIFIHLDQPLNQSQIEELESMGLTLYLDSWIPPLQNHPAGFILADMPIDKLDELADKGYVVRLDTETPGADANEDSEVNVLDITKIARIIIGLD